MLRAAEDAPVCITVTHLDGLICARSAFNHSANYRSVVLFGTPVAVTDPEEKRARLKTMMESIFPGRWDLLRPVTAKELAATRILSIPINEASAKLRSGPPAERQDLDWPVWAGVVPISTVIGEAQSDGEGVGTSDGPPGLVRPR